MFKRCLFILPTFLFLFAGTAQAEDPVLPEGTGGKQDHASSGSTELEDQGSMGSAKALDEENDADAPEDMDATEFDIASGGMINTGNSRSLALTGVLNFRHRRHVHQFSGQLIGNYGKSASEAWLLSTANIQGRVRYDGFVAHQWSMFLMTTARNDIFQGINLRLNVDPGVAFYLLAKKTHRVWFETGYDYQYETRTEESIREQDNSGNLILDDQGNTILVADKTDSNHAARVFAGYVNNIDERLTFTTGFEFLQSMLRSKRFRFNFDVALSTQIKERFSLATTFTLRYDNDPLPSVEKVDTITSINLAYRFL